MYKGEKMKEITEALKRYNIGFYQTENIYRLINKKLNIPYSYYQILYLLRSETCLPYGQKIVEVSGEPKQTINSALKKLEKDGIITLTKEENSKSKKILLTDKGKKYCEETIDKIIEAEINALNALQREKLDIFLDINDSFKHEIKKEFDKING